MRRTLSILLLVSTAALADDALTAARDAFVKGEFKQAIALARASVSEKPIESWKIIGASQCFLKDEAGARDAWDKLDEKGQSFLKYVCKRNGIALP